MRIKRRFWGKGVMVWFTGLGGSGKHDRYRLERELHKRGLLCRILDGDNIRSGINNNLGFSPETGWRIYAGSPRVGKLFVDTGVRNHGESFYQPDSTSWEMMSVPYHQ